MIRTCLFAIAVAMMTQAFGRSGLGAEGPPAAVDRRGSGGKPQEDRIGPKAGLRGRSSSAPPSSDLMVRIQGSTSG